MINLLACYLLAEAKAGTIDIAKVSDSQVKRLASSTSDPDLFIQQIKYVQQLLKDNRIKRKNMPVVDSSHMWLLQQMLAKGDLGQQVAMVDEEVDINCLLPTQSNIYLDKAMTIKDLSDSIFLVSNDYYLIDGHHRWLSGMLHQQPVVRVKRCSLNLDELLPLIQEFTDLNQIKRRE